MSAKRKAMGRGLDALFESNARDEAGGVSVISVKDIEPNKNQPRKNFDDASISELAESIKVHGIIQPIIVRAAGDGFYVIVAGERRYRAAIEAGLTEVPVIITELTSAEAAEVALVENIQRTDLNPIEIAEAYKLLIDDFSLTQQQLAERIGKPRSSVANALRLLDLPEKLKKYVAEGKLSDGHAKVLAGLDDAAVMIAAAETVIKLNMNVRATETYVKKLKTPKAVRVEDPQKKSYEAALSERMFASLGRKVSINKGKKHTLEITYTDNDDLEALIKRICGDDIFNF
ncbi:MAG: ParB/RepB/Spo0J family partition protein [Clostridia bacterium]|nr:ParB/RepB/Spo0J family partition protein [Clostridia bacterium]